MSIGTVPSVLVDLSVAPLGGAGTYAAGFAQGLVSAEIDHRDRLVVLLDRRWAADRQDLVDDLRGVGVVVDELDLPAPGTWRARLGRGATVRRAIARHDSDVAYFPRDAVPRVRCPYVVLANNLYAWQPFRSSAAVGGTVSAFLLRRMAGRSARGAAAVLVVSQPMADALDADIEVTGTVHHGCSLPEHPRSEEEDRTIVAMVGTVIANKGIDVVIEGIGLARSAGRPWELRVHGGTHDRELAEQLERQSREVLGTNALRGPARGDELLAAYQEAQVVVVGGSFESFCYPLVEAMRSGCVVVAPASALVTEICGAVAVTYREGDPSSLAAALEVAWSERRTRSAAGLERSRSFTWERAVAQTLTFVRASVGRPAGG